MSHVNFFQNSIAENYAVHREGIEELVRKNTTRQLTRELLNPANVETLQQFLLTQSHRRTALENKVRKLVPPQDVPGKQTFAGTEFDNGELVELLSPLLELS